MARKQTKARKDTAIRSSSESTTSELLLEIGTEELPSQFLPPALRSLADSAERLLKEHRLTHGAVCTFGTPRRLVLAVQSVVDRQASTDKMVVGPPKAVALDAKGDPTKAMLKFAESQGVKIGGVKFRRTSEGEYVTGGGLKIGRTPKGEYVIAVKHDPGRPTIAVLAELLPALVGSLTFPKSMRWNETGIRFARPIRWLLALYGGKVVGIEIGGIKAGNRTFGHRFLGSAGSVDAPGLPVKDFTTYVKTLERHGVIPDQDRRRVMILSQLTRLTKAAPGHLHRDKDLLEEAVSSVEYPHAILGEFEPHYLSLPKEVLMTAMKEHQGYFSLMGPGGALLPKFIVVANTKLPSTRLVREGNERVLAARLADAKFYYDEDRKIPLVDRLPRLSQVVFHQKLGTMYQKMERIRDLATFVASELGLPNNTVNSCRKAAELAKADLLSGMVGEFPTLQGVMGGEYARYQDESEEVRRGIAEQYLPRGMEGEIPTTTVGKVVALTDKLDTIVAFFHVDLMPTGSEDPFALRRSALSIVRILIEGKLHFDLAKAVVQFRERLRQQGIGAAHDLTNKSKAWSDDLLEFVKERFRYYGQTVHGLREDVMESVLKSSTAQAALDLVDLLGRMNAVQETTGRPEFDPLMIGFKRAFGIVEKEQWSSNFIDESLQVHPEERDLYKLLMKVEPVVQESINLKKDYARALEALVSMRPAIDAFFVAVMVNVDDSGLRANRLSLLYRVAHIFRLLADFSQISVQGT